MMKKTIKQLLGLSLSAAMVIGMAGCGNDAAPESKTPEKSQEVSEETETKSTEASESETQVAEVEDITYPLDTDETMTLWTYRLGLNSDYTDYKESPFHTGLSKQTGVDIEFIIPPAGADLLQAENLIWTEDVYPDVIFTATDKTKLNEFYEDGLIYDLTEYLPTYAPDYWAYITAPENEDVYRSILTQDGKILGFWGLLESNYNITYMGPSIRQDWLDECGLDVPVTLEDWENVLTTFKEKYDAALGVPAAYVSYPFFASGANAYGTTGASYYVDDNGKVQMSVLQPEWVEYMKVLNRWYDAGLLDKDSVTMDNNAVRTKVANNQIGASYGPMSQLTNYITDAENSGSGAKWVGVSYPRTAEGEPTNMIQSGIRATANIAFVTTSCSEEKLATVLKVLNYGYTEEGMMYWNFGEEGVSYTLNSKGEPEWTDLILNDPQGLNGAVQKYCGAASGAISVQLEAFLQKKNNAAVAEAVYAWTENTEVGDHYLPAMELTADEQTAYTDKYAAIRTYISEMAQKYLMGVESLDDIDAFYAQLEEMGIQDCLKIQQAAYDRYLAK